MREVHSINPSELKKKGWVEKKVLVPKTVYQKDNDSLLFEDRMWTLNNKQRVSYFEDLEDIKNNTFKPRE